jgi:hypothetical protein
LKVDKKVDCLRYCADTRTEQDEQFERINVPTGTHFDRHYSKQKEKRYQKRAKHIKRQKPEVVCISAEGIGKKIAEYSEYQSRNYRQYYRKSFTFKNRIQQKAHSCYPHNYTSVRLLKYSIKMPTNQ